MQVDASDFVPAFIGPVMVQINLHWKYYGSLFIALFILSPLAVYALANQKTHNRGLSDKCCVSTGENSPKPVQNHSHCKTHDDDMNDADSPCPCDVNSISFSCPYTQLSTRLEILERYKKLPNTYTAIFVPPQ
jgi:hypothetical protein